MRTNVMVISEQLCAVLLLLDAWPLVIAASLLRHFIAYAYLLCYHLLSVFLWRIGTIGLQYTVVWFLCVKQYYFNPNR